MIPKISLDDETFEKMMDQAIKQLPGLYPVWTDYNYHDPGITILELFAWFTELQRFHLDQTGEEYLRKYWKLLGIRPRGITPAYAKVRICSLSSRTWFPAGSRFYAEGVCFETIEPRVVDGTEVQQMVFVKAGNSRDDAVRQMVAENNVDFFAFGTQPHEGDALWIGLNAALTEGVRYHLCMEFSIMDASKRNPFDEEFEFVPLAEYRLMYWNGNHGCETAIHKDTTHGLLQDGELVFSIDGKMLPGEDNMFWLTLVLTDAQYDLAPVLTHISLQELTLRQIKTCAELHEIRLGREWSSDARSICTYLAGEGEYLLFVETENGFRYYEGRVLREQSGEGIRFRLPDLPGNEDNILCLLVLYEAAYNNKILLGKGDGTEFQTFEVRLPHLCRDGLVILAETEDGSGCYELWEEQDDLDASGSGDRHFHFEEQTGIVKFGNGIHGRMPSGELLLAAAHTSLGAGGNVKAGKIHGAGEGIISEGGTGCEYTAQNDREAAGGMDCETHGECRRRLSKRIRESERAVTYDDFAQLAAKTPGLAIERVRAIPASTWDSCGYTPKEETVTLVVKPYARESRPRLSETYRKNILRMLEPRRMIGTSIEVLAPEYIGVIVSAEIYSNIHIEAAKKCIFRKVQEFFDGIRADFGVVIHLSALYGMLDILDCVIGIHVLRMDAQGVNVRRNQNGDILLPANGLAYLKELTCIVSTGKEGVHER